MTGLEHPDPIVEALALSEAALREDTWRLHQAFCEMTERALRAEADRDALHLVAATWAHQSRQQHLEHERLQNQVERLRDENRSLRTSVMTQAIAA